MKLLSDFMPRLLTQLPGCPEPMAKQALVDSAITFCEKSQLLREKQTLVISQGVDAYTLAGATDQVPSRVLNVWVDDNLLKPYPVDTVPVTTSPLGKPTSYYTTRQDSALKLVLYPTPDQAYTTVVDVAMRPTRTASSLQDDLFEIWLDPVIQGALGRLMQISGQSFTDPLNGQTKENKAIFDANRARIDANKGRVRASQRVVSRPFVK